MKYPEGESLTEGQAIRSVFGSPVVGGRYDIRPYSDKPCDVATNACTYTRIVNKIEQIRLFSTLNYRFTSRTLVTHVHPSNLILHVCISYTLSNYTGDV